MPTTDATILDPKRSDRMSTGENAGPVHPVPTGRSGHRYFFYTKHHGGEPGAAMWNPELTHEEEFGVFDLADRHDLSDERGWLYGVARAEDGGLRDLGTWEQQVAEFPHARPNEAWHGYPLWPLSVVAPQNRRGEKFRPAKEVFLRMVAVGLLTKSEQKRLAKGRHQ